MLAHLLLVQQDDSEISCKPSKSIKVLCNMNELGV